MTKGKLLDDTFEQLVELGSSTAKKTVKSVAQTLNPFSSQSVIPSEADLSTGGEAESRNLKTSEVKKAKNHTPLDFQKLQNKFQDKEKVKTEVLRNRLFQMVRQGDERLLMEKRQKELEKKRQEIYLEQEKKRKEEEKKKKMAAPIPLG